MSHSNVKKFIIVIITAILVALALMFVLLKNKKRLIKSLGKIEE